MRKNVVHYILALVFLTIATSSDIVRRHDRTDREYLEFGAKFPSVCKIGKKGGDGTLIAPKWIITAGHVAQGMFRREGKDLKVYFENETIERQVDRVFVHPDFAPMRGSDIALILLKDPIESIVPASINQKRNEKGKEIVIVGHGYAKTGQGGDWATDGERRAATNIIDEITEDKIIFDFDAPPGGTYLEGTAGPGDSGGPAFIMQDETPSIAGISSAGMPGKNGPGSYGAIEHYTRVSSYKKWIDEVKKNPSVNRSLGTNVATNLASGPTRVVTGRPDGGPLPGLGLFLMQEGNTIRIGGKVDPMVPASFRQVMFKPPSFIESFNNKKYTSLDAFKTDFRKLKKGESFTIQFKIQGEIKTFKGKKM